MEKKHLLILDMDGLKPLTADKYRIYVEVLVDGRKIFTDEDELITSELARMSKAIIAFNEGIGERPLYGEEIDDSNNLDRYVVFLKERLRFLEIEKKTNVLFAKNFEESGTEKGSLGNLNAVQKIILLNELGIIELLYNNPAHSTSINNMAYTVSLMTGEQQTTIQPYLNALLTKTEAENKHPYYTKTTVEKVHKVMAIKGIQSKKT